MSCSLDFLHLRLGYSLVEPTHTDFNFKKGKSGRAMHGGAAWGGQRSRQLLAWRRRRAVHHGVARLYLPVAALAPSLCLSARLKVRPLAAPAPLPPGPPRPAADFTSLVGPLPTFSEAPPRPCQGNEAPPRPPRWIEGFE